MAFNLKKVLKALLLSTNQPLGIKDIQAAFTRYHDQAASLPMVDAAEEPVPGTPAETAQPPDAANASSDAVAPVAQAEGDSLANPQPAADTVSPGAGEAAEVLVDDTPQDPELYVDVPSLITATQIREAMDLIATELKASDDGLLLIEGNNGYRIVTHPRFARWVRILRQEPPPVKLSQSAIETLAVIAYRQPVTRGEIETIRGVSAEAGVNKLLERELIYVVGRADAPGRPIQYGTTDQFLEFVGIKSLDELPASDVLSSRQIDDWLKQSESTRAPTDADVGLSDEQLPLTASADAQPVETAEIGEAEPAAEPGPAPEPDEQPPAAQI